MSTDFVIQAENISKCYRIFDRPEHSLWQLLFGGRKQYYREFWALKSLSFEIKKGETLGIVGRNGSGKSTLLQMICGTLNPSGGSIRTTGRIAALLELGSGFNPEYTGRENIYLNAAVLGLNKQEVDQKFQQIIDFAEIGDFIEQPIKTYSSGMVVRLAFAVIAHVDADILVVDEALAVGDAVFTQKCMRFIREFKKTGTLLFVSHDENAVANLCDHVLWLSAGELQAIGPTTEVLTKYHSDNIARVQQQTKLDAHESYEVVTSKIDIGSSVLAALLRSKETVIRNQSAGEGKAVIVGAAILDSFGKVIELFEGGESVKLCLLIEVRKSIAGLLVGFSIKDRLGQKLIEENNSTFVREKSIKVEGNKTFVASFDFNIPLVKSGKYSIDVAVAEGLQANHVPQTWLFDAIQIEFRTKDDVFGLFTMGLKNFELEEVNG